ncbi:MAG: CcoQ/FixQ family Cbb3-type cytochrome c oxidase assembly chaperone [Thermotogales bacterium]|nr:CcoQ/FixQ family Cbb3-type cytochrome c oxidase assembly chaperone [Thermotogales bacterium]
MPDWFLWFTRFENSKVVALLLFFTTFCAILIYLYTGKKRAKRLESYKYMPLQEDEQDLNAANGGEETHESDKR